MSAELPDKNGYYGEFGGRYAPELLMQAVLDLDQAWLNYSKDENFQKEFQQLLALHGGRQTPLYLASNLTKHAGGAQIYLKREDLTSTGSHHINAALGQALLGKKLGCSLLIAETSTGMHGIAVAKAAQVLDLECNIYIGAAHASRQLDVVSEMKSFGADVSIVGPDSATLLDANEVAYRSLLSDMQSSFYVANSIVGPHPYPTMVREFQTVIGMEVKQQIMSASGALPDHLIAYAAGGSNALGLFYPFLDTEIALSGVESSGSQGEQPTRLRDNRPGIYQGTKTLMRQDGNGQLMASESLAVGLQASLLGPEYSHLLSTGRINCESVSDKEALNACALGQELEDITFSLESAHAIARGLQLASDLQADKTVVINVSGRGEKDATLISGEQL